MTQFDKAIDNYIEEQFIQGKPQEDMQSFARLLKKNRMKKVLDHGCGSGRNTVYLAKHGLSVSGFDISDLCLNNTRKWLKNERLYANLKKHNIFEKLPYKNERFDAVISIRAMGNNKKGPIKKAIDDIHRVLKYGGYFYLQTDKMTTEVENYLPTKFRKLVKNTYLQLEGYQKGTIHYLFSEESIKEMFNNFKILDVHMDKSKRLYSILAQKF